jgi:hypothetical protein
MIGASIPLLVGYSNLGGFDRMRPLLGIVINEIKTEFWWGNVLEDFNWKFEMGGQHKDIFQENVLKRECGSK